MEMFAESTARRSSRLTASSVVHLVRQDLSIAGKRAGLAGARSGRFMEQIRIVKEMRKRDADTGRTGEFLRPRYMVWENVTGAFSSNKGKDFAAVLEETIRIAEPEAPGIEVPEKGWPTWGGTGTWTDNGAFIGEFSTLNTSEYLNVAVESRLSQILEDAPLLAGICLKVVGASLTPFLLMVWMLST